MSDYYFKIKKGDVEFEFSTTDKSAFEEQLYDWLKGFSLNEEPDSLPTPKIAGERPERKGFIEIKNLTTINDMQVPDTLTSTESFDTLLDMTIEKPTTDVVEKKIDNESFESYAVSFNPEEPMDYLMLSSKFLMEKEHLERFSLKQLNAKIVPLTENPITHDIINQAIEDGLLRVIPDLTGLSEVTEYTLTEKGEGYFIE